MYEFLRGELTEKRADCVVLDVNGVGYLLKMGRGMQEGLPEIGEVCRILCSHQSRENAQELYGFVTAAQKQLFELLLNVNGVGPKGAMKILSEVAPQDFAAAVLRGDSKGLQKKYKLGPKMAERVVLELKDRLKKSELGRQERSEARATGELATEAVLDTMQQDLFSALTVLGYARHEAMQMIAKSYRAELGLEENIRAALSMSLPQMRNY